jgi:16S rRNA (uracil1498-N3)-methyltransferase
MLRLLISCISNTRDRVNLFYQPRIPQGIHYLDEDESRHCIKVLRKRNGDTLHITDGQGNFYNARIASEDISKCSFEIISTISDSARDFKIEIAISPTKNADRIEWFIEKAVEIGVDSITLIDCKHTERTHVKTDRLQKVAISAMKQSVKARLPKLNGLTHFNAFIKSVTHQGKFIAYVDATNPLHLKDAAKPNQDCLVLIGPEGDFSTDELQLALSNGFQKVSLGTSRLRTETAGLAACHILNLINS